MSSYSVFVQVDIYENLELTEINKTNILVLWTRT